MLVNNPTYTIRLIDLVDNMKVPFEYTDIYKVVGEWLNDLQPNFYTNDKKIWEDFIKRFCDRYYSRNLNFDTYLEFKIKLRSLLDSKKMTADRYVKLNALKINPWCTYGTDKTTKGNRETKADSKTESTNKGKSENSSYNLHSDTPASTVNVKNIVNGNTNYVTYADNTGATSSNETTGTSKGNTSANETNIYEELANGYQGNIMEILEKIDDLTNDVTEKYLLWIEESHLFSSVLY